MPKLSYNSTNFNKVKSSPLLPKKKNTVHHPHTIQNKTTAYPLHTRVECPLVERLNEVLECNRVERLLREVEQVLQKQVDVVGLLLEEGRVHILSHQKQKVLRPHILLLQYLQDVLRGVNLDNLAASGFRSQIPVQTLVLRLVIEILPLLISSNTRLILQLGWCVRHPSLGII